jgi:hypothetical protein
MPVVTISKPQAVGLRFAQDELLVHSARELESDSDVARLLHTSESAAHGIHLPQRGIELSNHSGY